MPVSVPVARVDTGTGAMVGVGVAVGLASISVGVATSGVMRGAIGGGEHANAASIRAMTASILFFISHRLAIKQNVTSISVKAQL